MTKEEFSDDSKMDDNERITITIDKNLLDWLDKKIEEKTFANRSHALEFLCFEKKEKDAMDNISIQK